MDLLPPALEEEHRNPKNKKGAFNRARDKETRLSNQVISYRTYSSIRTILVWTTLLVFGNGAEVPKIGKSLLWALRHPAT